MNILEESLIIISKSGRHIGYRTSLLLRGELVSICKDETEKVCLWTSLFNLNILDVCSFIDEYEKILGPRTENKFKDRISITKSICKPVIKEIKKWKDLKIVRNSFVAHNFRLSSGNMFYNQESINYNVPRNIPEMELLSNYVQIICHVILSEFAQEYENIDKSQLAKSREHQLLTRDIGHDFVKNTILKVNSLIEKNKREYLLKIK
jgi:hypothetical protein